MPDDDFLRSLLRDQWHLVPSGMTGLPLTLMSRGWEFTTGGEPHLLLLAETASRQPLEAGLAAALHLRGTRIAAGEPVRTLGGALTVATPDGAAAVLRRIPGRRLSGRDPIDQQWWGERLGVVHQALRDFRHPGLRPWRLPAPATAHPAAAPWLRAAVVATTRLTVTDQLTYGVLHGDPEPGAFVLDPATGRTGLLHCGASGTGPLVYDVAAAVAYAGGPERCAELLDGYRATGPVGADELDAALPVLLRLRWAMLADSAARRGCPETLTSAREALESMPG